MPSMDAVEIVYEVSDVVAALARIGDPIRSGQGVKAALRHGRIPHPSRKTPRGSRIWTEDDLCRLLAHRTREAYLRRQAAQRRAFDMPQQMELRRAE